MLRATLDGVRVLVGCGIAVVYAASAVSHGSAASGRLRQESAATVTRAAVSSPDQDVPPVRIDAVVTDAKGRPVLDLEAADFELIENGTRRTLSHVELRAGPPPVAGEMSPIKTEAEEVYAARRQGTRVFAFFLDEFHVQAGPHADRVRESVSRFVDEHLRPQDLALVIKPLDAVNGFRFTRDRAHLGEAIRTFAGRKDDVTPRSGFEEQYIGRAPGAVAAARAQIVTAALRELTLRFGELEADRGVVVLVSEGFTPNGPRGARENALQGLVRAASRIHLAMYTFNPGQGTDRGGDPGSDPAGATLEWLAAQTGGRAVLRGGELARGFERMGTDLGSYYALTYLPGQGDGGFHPFEVRAKRRNADVRTRPGYWAPLAGEARALLAERVPTGVTRGLRRSPLIETRIGIASDAEGRTRMVITWEPRGAGLPAPRLVVVQARTTTGAELFNGQLAAVQDRSAARSDSARFDVPVGRVQLDLSILDAEGKAIESEIRDFDVPDLPARKQGPMLLFPEVVRARTLRDFRNAVADPDAAPSSGRVFARGDRLLIRVPAYDSSGAAVEVSATLLNEWGQPMRALDAAESASDRAVAQFALPLAWLGPGQYLIELAGANANGIVRERFAFRVRG